MDDVIESVDEIKIIKPKDVSVDLDRETVIERDGWIESIKYGKSICFITGKTTEGNDFNIKMIGIDNIDFHIANKPRWIIGDVFECSECGIPSKNRTAFCPHCGAKMEL